MILTNLNTYVYVLCMKKKNIYIYTKYIYICMYVCMYSIKKKLES